LESAAYSAIGEHLQKLHNAGSRREAQFFNTLLKGGRPMRAPFLFPFIMAVANPRAFTALPPGRTC
jgi:hypothetical protein